MFRVAAGAHRGENAPSNEDGGTRSPLSYVSSGRGDPCAVPKLKTPPEGATQTPDPAAEPPAVDPLGRRLRDMFQAVESAPVPDEITRLVETLEKKRSKRRDPGGAH